MLLIQCAMSVSEVCNVVMCVFGGKYVFATVMCVCFVYVYPDQLWFCVVCTV